MMQRRQFLKMPERIPLPSVNKNPAQRIPSGGIGDAAKAVAVPPSPAMLLRSMRAFRTYSLMVKSRAIIGSVLFEADAVILASLPLKKAVSPYSS